MLPVQSEVTKYEMLQYFCYYFNDFPATPISSIVSDGFGSTAFIPTTTAFHSFNEFNLKLSPTLFPQFMVWSFALTHRAALIFPSKISVWSDQLHNTIILLPHPLILQTSQLAHVTGTGACGSYYTYVLHM